MPEVGLPDDVPLNKLSNKVSSSNSQGMWDGFDK